MRDMQLHKIKFKIKTMQNILELEILSDQELVNIDGGSTMWEYIFYGFGYYVSSTSNNIELLEGAIMSV
jgi:hypothetical protein